MQEFGLAHLSLDELQHAFVEFRPLLGRCKFNDCRHIGEPGCAVIEAAQRGEIGERRLTVYRKLVGELARSTRWVR
jgi:ribosome biogenesis GTPase